jgi:hypothetical protein
MICLSASAKLTDDKSISGVPQTVLIYSWINEFAATTLEDEVLIALVDEVVDGSTVAVVAMFCFF